MKLELNTTIKGAEVANFLIGHAIKSLSLDPLRGETGITDTDLKNAENFRKSLVKAILKS